MTERTLYVVYNKDCGHLLGATNERWMCERQISALTVAGKWGWRIRVGISDAEIESLIKGDRCEICTLDGIAVPS